MEEEPRKESRQKETRYSMQEAFTLYSELQLPVTKVGARHDDT